MLLRDQDLRNLNYSDCFSTIISRTQHRGVQQSVTLLFSLDKGKTLKDGDVRFACAIRHYNLSRCPVSASAFYLFSKFQKEPSFLRDENWQMIKVLTDKVDPMSSSQQYDATKKIFLAHDIHISRITHGGRHSGAMEAESLGMPFDTIKKGGGWKDRLGRLETHYLGKVPSEFAHGLAGFWNKPFGLERNRVDPPIELQKKIFPWVEDFFGDSAAWKKECLDEMNEKDENEYYEGDVSNPDYFVQEHGEEDLVEGHSREKGKQAKVVYRSVDVARRGF